MQNKNTIVFSNEDLIFKKKITGFLRNHNIEFTPKKNYYGDYEAIIKVRNTSSAKKNEIGGVRIDKEYRNKIDSMFNLISGTAEPSKGEEFQVQEETPERNIFGIVTNASEKRSYNTEKNQEEIEQPESAHFRPGESEQVMSSKRSSKMLRLDDGDQVNMMVSPDKDNSGRISKNADSGYKVQLKEQSEISVEPSVRLSEGSTQRKVYKSASRGEIQTGGSQNIKSNLNYSSLKELRAEDQEEDRRILAIARSLGKLQQVEEAPSVTPFKIVTDNSTTVKEEKSDVNNSYSVIETPTIGQFAYERGSKAKLAVGNVKKSLEEAPVRNMCEVVEKREAVPEKGQAIEVYNEEFYGSKKSSSASIFTLCGEDAKRERNLMEIVGNAPPSSERTEKEEDGDEGFEVEEEDEIAQKFKQWQEMIYKDDFLKQMLAKIKENTDMDETEGLAMLIGMLQDNLEEEDEDGDDAKIDSAPSEMAKKNAVESEKKKKKASDYSCTPTRKTKDNKGKQSGTKASSSDVKHSSSSASLKKNGSKPLPMTSEKPKAANEPQEYVSSLQRKAIHSESGSLNPSMASSKSLQVPRNVNTNSIYEINGIKQSFSCQTFQVNLGQPAQEELMKKALAMEELNESGNLSIDHDKFYGRGSYRIEDEISSIQYQDKSMEITRGMLETMDGRVSYNGTAEDKGKGIREAVRVNSFGGGAEYEYEGEREGEGEEEENEENVLTDEEIYRNNWEVMKNIKNIVSRSPSANKKGSASKASLRSEPTLNKANMSKMLSQQNLTRELTSGKASATSLIDDEKGRIERRRFTREKYNEHSRRSFQNLLNNVEVKQESWKAKEAQVKSGGMSTRDVTKYLKTLVAKKKLETIEQSRKKPKGEHTILLY